MAQAFKHQWTRVDNSTPTRGMFVRADNDGNCYNGYVHGDNLRIFKWMRDGNPAWNLTIPIGTAVSNVELRDMVLTDFGVYLMAAQVGGQTFLTKTIVTGATLAGSQFPVREFSLQANCNPADLASDESDNLFVLGSTSGGGPLTSNMFVLKYERDLDRYWEKVFPPKTATEVAGHIAVSGPNDSIYFTQTEVGDLGPRFKLNRLDWNGNPVWSKTYELDDENTSMGVGVDSNDRPIAYIRGVTGTNHRSSTCKWDRDGLPLWTSIFSYPAPDRGNEELIVEDANSVFISGTGTFSGTQRGFVRSFDGENGFTEWTNIFAGMPLAPRSVNAMDTDTYGQIYTACTAGTGDNRIFRIVKLDRESGQLVWSASYDGDAGASPEVPEDIAANYYGDVFIIGTSAAGAPPLRTVYLEQGPIGQNPLYRFKNNFTSSVPAHQGLLSWRNAYTGNAETPITITQQPTNATMSISTDGSFIYAPDAGHSGMDQFKYKIAKGELESPEFTATVRVGTVGKLSGFTIAPNSIASGTSTTGRITLDAPAGTLNNPVAINDNSSAIFAPSAVDVLTNETVHEFLIRTANLTANATRTITATHEGVTKPASLTLLAGTAKYYFIHTFQPTIVGGTSATGTVHSDRPAPAGGIVVALSDNTSAITVPASVTIPAGATSATFTINTSPVSSVTTRRITGTGSGTTDFIDITLTPKPALLAFSLNPSTIKGGTHTLGTALLSVNPQTPLSIGLTDNSSAIAAPPSFIGSAGYDVGKITIQTSAVSSTATRTVTASLDGISRTANLTLTP